MSGRGNSQCKGPEVGLCLVFSRNGNEARVAGGSGEQRVHRL